MEHFDSFKNYLRFVVASNFVHKEDYRPFTYSKNRWEKIGEAIASPILKPGDYILKNIRNPLFITAVVIVGIALTTLVFYPALIPQCLALTTVSKAGGYLMIQSTIIGLCIRMLGRLHNQQLMSAWDKQDLQPINIGTTIIRI